MFKTLYCNWLLILVNNGLKFVWGTTRFATKTQTGLLQKTFQLPISLIMESQFVGCVQHLLQHI